MTDFSPAAQAVIKASNCSGSRIVQLHIAAGLRAAIDEVIPLYVCNTTSTRGKTRLCVRTKLLDIANELDQKHRSDNH